MDPSSSTTPNEDESRTDLPDQGWKIQVYTGDGKGKTTCAIGLVIRALGNGFRVAMIQFDKGFAGEEHYGERHVLRKLEGLELHPTGCERMTPGGKFRFGVTAEDRAEAQRGLQLAQECLRNPQIHLLILDEVLSAISYHLIKESELLYLLDGYKYSGRPFELVLTGRRATPTVLERADLVTEMKPLKHYFDVGVAARKGIEF